MNKKQRLMFCALCPGLIGLLILLVDTVSSFLPVWTVFFGFALLIAGAISTNIVYQINKKGKKKKAKQKEKRSKWVRKLSTQFWKSEKTKVCEERLKHYESTGNRRKADIYRRKLGK